MTEHDEAQAVESKAAPDPGGAPAPGPGRPKVVCGWIMFFAGVVLAWIVCMAVYWDLVAPNPLYAKKIQPFNFNHYVHTEDSGMGCDECHKYDDQGRFLGLPDIQECFMCHTWSDRQNEDNPNETAFLEKYVDKDTDEPLDSPQWLVYSAQPDCVFFSHIAHTEMGGLSCEECHGDHGKSKSLEPLYENRLTGYSRKVYQEMKMTDCGDCHEKKGKPENNYCFVCHK
ncbi:MAG: menaquinone reductase multiheme cytochrome c subunit QrcA [Thermodesulfobacteriota bacterium]